MRIRSTVFLKVLAVSITCVVGCSKQPPAAPANYADGNCVGTVKDEAGSPVAGASLMLVPEGYSPLSAANGSTIDSTTSDAYGRYGFTIDAPGVYNLIAKSKGFFAMRRAIRISADARVILDDEILRDPGSMSGTVHLQDNSDHRGAIILLMGTNVYAKPFDSTGAFSFAALAEGLYTLRILTAENDYAVAETTVTVTSAMHTALSLIELQKKFVPIIDSLSAAYDPVMIRAVLSWPAIDTARIRNYAVYCNRSIKNIEPIAIMDKSATMYSFDIFTSPLDTFLYEISAIGNDGIEGPSTSAKPFVKYSAIDLDTITSAVPLKLDQEFCFDRNDNIFTFLGYKIIKLDPKGNHLGEFVLSCDTTGDTARFYTVPCIDTSGNIYALASSRASRLLMKFNNDLQLVREFPLDSSRDFSFAVSAAGAIMLSVPPRPGYNDAWTYRWIYDPRFNLVEKDSFPETLSILNSVSSNDMTVCLFTHDRFYKRFRVVYFDNTFKEIFSPIDLDSRSGFHELSSMVPSEYEAHLLSMFVVFKNLFAVQYVSTEPSSNMLLFFDDRLQPVARMPFDIFYVTCPIFSFDSKGNCYCVIPDDMNSVPPRYHNKIHKYSVAKILK